jgi:hypothetical protein
MPKELTLEQLTKMSVEQRQQLYRNCMERIDDNEAVTRIDLIVSSGLQYRKDKEIAHGDPEMRAIEMIVNASENEPRLLKAAADGLPPLAAIEPLIVAKLGSGYRGTNGGTIAAGYLIAKRLYALGYEKRPSKKMPEGSVAKTAATFRKKLGS